MKEYKKIFKVFLAGQEDKETTWLSQMSKQGYHLQNVSFASYYVFKKGTPSDYTYIIDMKDDYSFDDGEYLAMYEDVGLEYVDTSNQYYYFRGNNDIKTMDIIKNEKGRYLDRLVSQGKVILLMAVINILIFAVNFYEMVRGINIEHDFISYLNLGAGLLCLFGAITVNKKIEALKREGVKIQCKTKISDWGRLWKLTIIVILMMIIYGVCLMFSL